MYYDIHTYTRGACDDSSDLINEANLKYIIMHTNILATKSLLNFYRTVYTSVVKKCPYHINWYII